MDPREPIPLVLLITELDPGGAERALVELAIRLDPRAWRVSVIGLGPEGALVQPLRDAGIDVECLGVSPRRPVRALTRLVKALRKRRPRLVQSFLFHANLAARLARPFVGPYAVVAGLRVAERGKRWHLTLDRWTSGLCDRWVCVSQGVRRHAIDEGGLNPDRLVVIPNGVNLDRFQNAVPVARSELGAPNDARIALFVGRIDPQKGWRVLLEAMNSAMIRSSTWRLIMVGDGPERDDLQARLQQDSDSRTRWLGRRDDVPALLAAADLLILPSLWEGMPNVVLEAMAAGKPVIATDVEGSQELVAPGETGWLVPAGDSQALASALNEADADPSRLSRFGANAQRFVAEHCSWDRVAEAYERLWTELFSAPNHR